MIHVTTTLTNMKKIYSLLICLTLTANVVAQSKMYVLKKDGTTVTFDVNDIEEINFVDSNTKSFVVNGVSFNMIKVDAGTFTMGMIEGDKLGASHLETPHEVTLTKDFYLAETECTQALWTAVMGTNPSRFKGDNKPVDKIEWDDAKAFIEKLNEITGEQFRLPTEAEWEYAAKGGNKSKGYLYAGSDSLGEVAWYAGNAVFENNQPGHGTHPVGMKKPNELGLYDMTGNVWEWCEDQFAFYTDEPQTDPLIIDDRCPSVFKGGGWDFLDDYCRSSYHYLPANRYYDVGFRLCLTVD